ncbi:hypothetical protein Tco_0673041 [Tanacetum coccineum]
MEPLSKRKFGIVFHGSVRIPLEGDEILLRVHGKQNNLNKPQDLQDEGVHNDLVNFQEEHQCCLFKKRSMEFHLKLAVGIRVRKSRSCMLRVKLRRVRAMSMTIQSSVFKGLKILAITFKSRQTKEIMNEDGSQSDMALMHQGPWYIREWIRPTITLERCIGSKNEYEYDLGDGRLTDQWEWNSGDDQLRLRWMIYLVVLADAAESVRDTIGFEYCLASSSGWTKSPVLWAEIGESSLTGPELVLDMTDKVVLIKEKLKAARDRQKSYADNRRKPLEFEVGDRVMLKVSPWKGVIRFGKKGKLAPRYVGPFEILERVGPVAYRLRLPEELSGIKVDKTLRFVEEPVENSDREVKRLKCSRMVVVKVHLGSKRGL